MFIVSSTDVGLTWEKEYELVTGKDLREPFFLEANIALATKQGPPYYAAAPQ